MGWFLWMICQKIRCSDGVAVGTMTTFKTFTPWPTLLLQNSGIFRSPEMDADAEEIVSVGWVETPNQAAPGYFRVDLEEDETDLPYHEARELYGPRFEWIFTHNPENSP
jgi:hypothetical protein